MGPALSTKRAARGRPSRFRSRRSLPNSRLDDLARVRGRFALGQRVDVFHAALDLAPDGVLAVEEFGVVEADEELRVGAVGDLRAGHRAGAAGVRFAVEFGLEVGLVAAAHAGAGRIAALRHEAGDHAVEDHPVVEAFARERGDAFDMAGREIGTQLDDHVLVVAIAGVESEGQLVRHRGISCDWLAAYIGIVHGVSPSACNPAASA